MSESMRLLAANEFTPGQLGGYGAMRWLLQNAAGAPNRAAFTEAIRDRWFSDSAASRSDHATRVEQQLKRAANVVTGMRQYGLLELKHGAVALTALGSDIYRSLAEGATQDAAELLAVHLLLNGHGLELLRAAERVRRQQGRVQNAAIADELRLDGFDISNNNQSASKMRQWLSWSGVIDENWRVDNSRLQEVIGFNLDEVSDWYSLSWVQRAFLLALHDLNVVAGEWVATRFVLSILDEQGIAFDRAQARRSIYLPLFEAGWLDLSVNGDGRHSKGGDVRELRKSREFPFAEVGAVEPDPLPIAIQEALSTDIGVIVANLRSSDTGVKGLALEVLAVRIARDLGMVPRELRVRGVETGGAEVDLLAERVGFSFERWTIQCKNQSAPVSVGVVAKEVGVAAVLRSQVVVVVTTNSFTQSAVDFASAVNESNSVQVMLVDGEIVADYGRRGVASIQESFRSIAADVARSKARQRNATREA
ncbi:restriction endonuclease [Curtobacterium sp. NPDC090217]|uniref:restriction endonuclease n=1 Tax=Curtobacterium sp. NPDC090217 TaxID=3363970 RepID=UPI003828766C